MVLTLGPIIQEFKEGGEDCQEVPKWHLKEGLSTGNLMTSIPYLLGILSQESGHISLLTTSTNLLASCI